MFGQIFFVQTVQLAAYSEMLIKLSDSLEFTVKRQIVAHTIYNIKGNFKIAKIIETYDDGERHILMYNKSSNSFQAHDRSFFDTKTLTFYIIEMSEMAEMKEMCAVKYELQILSTILQRLRIKREFYESQFVLPGYDGYKFSYYVTKISESKQNDIQIQIKNPYDVEIEGKKGDFNFICDSTEKVNLPLLFTFYTDEILIEEIEPNSNDLHGLLQEPLIDESRPESVIPSFSSNATTLLHKIATKNLFADVFFISSDGEKIPSHCCILAASSDIFLKIFEESTEIPVQITTDDFDAETIQSALNYLYDKSDAINGKETEVFKFAVKFGIQHLIGACLSVFEDSVSPSNVCEFIEIAYFHNFEHLKQK